MNMKERDDLKKSIVTLRNKINKMKTDDDNGVREQLYAQASGKLDSVERLIEMVYTQRNN